MFEVSEKAREMVKELFKRLKARNYIHRCHSYSRGTDEVLIEGAE